MNDITAVVLTLGEETTKRAIDSLERQTVLPNEIIIIGDVTPFHRALNLGASKVKIQFFIQVDSDMILDENCLEGLRKCMTDNVGVAIGQLRDPLMGMESGVKMFRKKCFDEVQLKDSVSPDNDFYLAISKYGWETIYILNLRNSDKTNNFRHTFGEHRPNYTSLYTYARYYLLGARYRYLKYLEYLKWRFQQLHINNHTHSTIAQIAISHGLFSKEVRDSPKNSLLFNNRDYEFLEKFSTSKERYEIAESDISSLMSLEPKKVFKKFYKLGINLRNNNSFPAFKYCMDLLGKNQDKFAWLAKVGLCHGNFSKAFSENRVNKDYKMLKELL